MSEVPLQLTASTQLSCKLARRGGAWREPCGARAARNCSLPRERSSLKPASGGDLPVVASQRKPSSTTVQNDERRVVTIPRARTTHRREVKRGSAIRGDAWRGEGLRTLLSVERSDRDAPQVWIPCEGEGDVAGV